MVGGGGLVLSGEGLWWVDGDGDGGRSGLMVMVVVVVVEMVTVKGTAASPITVSHSGKHRCRRTTAPSAANTQTFFPSSSSPCYLSCMGLSFRL